jgi:hypothetical protein
MTYGPLTPPLRGLSSTERAIARQDPAPSEADCTLFECDQCGRTATRPHAADGRIFCRHCCPTCARRAAAQTSA